MSAGHPIFNHSAVFTFYFQEDQDSGRWRILGGGRAGMCTAASLIAVLTESPTQYICRLSFLRV